MLFQLEIKFTSRNSRTNGRKAIGVCKCSELHSIAKKNNMKCLTTVLSFMIIQQESRNAYEMKII